MRRALALLSALPLLSGGGAAAQQIDTLALRGHTYFLASDLLEGRGTGTRGERLAASYIVAQLQRLGLEGAAPDGGYHLPVPLRAARVDDAATRLVVRAGRDSTVYRSRRDFVLNTGGAGAFRDFAGPAVFAGHPVQAAAALEGRDLKGRVVVVVGALGGAGQELVPDWIRRGAAGVVLLVPEPDRFALYVRSRGDTRYYVDAPVGDPIWQPDLPVLIAGPALSAALLGTVAVPGPKEAFRAVDLGRDVAGTVRVEVRELPVANIGGLLRGSDPARADEVVVYTAHYDHLGISDPDERGDSIYNGFSDNAAGTAMLLSIAQAMRADPPARSVLFLFFTGEERGLLGSSYYASAPAVPLDRVRAVINLDAGAPPAPPLDWHIAGGVGSPLGELAGRVAAEAGWRATPTPASPNSDYWPFLARGVPSIFIIPGGDWEGLGADERVRLRKRWDHYHQAGDHWAADFPFSGLQRYADFALRVGRAAASSAR